jgi:hypothetical protein
MAEENSGSNAAIWAFVLVPMVALIFAVLFFGGVMSTKKTDVDVEIKAPSR